ncbi:hypothetical protein ACLOJK_027315 [Asimina triloba]
MPPKYQILSLPHPKILIFPSNYVTAATAHIPSHVACVNKTIRFHLRNGDLDFARQVFNKTLSKTNFSWNLLLTGYSRLGKLEDALQLFQQIPQSDVYSYIIMLSCYFQNSDIVSARRLFDRMPEYDDIWPLSECEDSGSAGGVFRHAAEK